MKTDGRSTKTHREKETDNSRPSLISKLIYFIVVAEENIENIKLFVVYIGVNCVNICVKNWGV